MEEGTGGRAVGGGSGAAAVGVTDGDKSEIGGAAEGAETGAAALGAGCGTNELGDRAASEGTEVASDIGWSGAMSGSAGEAVGVSATGLLFGMEGGIDKLGVGKCS